MSAQPSEPHPAADRASEHPSVAPDPVAAPDPIAAPDPVVAPDPAVHRDPAAAPDPTPVVARGRVGAWVEQRRRAVGVAAILIALGLAALWLVVVPEAAQSSTGLRAWALRYGHSLCWALLATTAALWLARAPRRLVDAVAWAALAAYGGFLLALAV